MSKKDAVPDTITMALLAILFFLLQGYDLYKHFDRILSKNAIQIMNCMPARPRAVHICTGSGKSVMELVLPVLKQMGGREFRLRTNLHGKFSSHNITCRPL
jgi:hypothetical protein